MTKTKRNKADLHKRKKASKRKTLIKENVLRRKKALLEEALNNAKWDYRTAAGIAKELHMKEEEVIELLKDIPGVYKSMVRSKDGKDLYAHKDNMNLFKDWFNGLRSINSEKYK